MKGDKCKIRPRNGQKTKPAKWDGRKRRHFFPTSELNRRKRRFLIKRNIKKDNTSKEKKEEEEQFTHANGRHGRRNYLQIAAFLGQRSV